MVGVGGQEMELNSSLSGVGLSDQQYGFSLLSLMSTDIVACTPNEYQ